MSTPTLVAAHADVLVKRARLKASIAEARHRLAPATIASNVATDLRDRTLAAAEDGIEAARERPAMAASIATGLVAILARKRIRRMFRRKPKPLPATPKTHPAPGLEQGSQS